MKYIIANWKMNMSFEQVNRWLEQFQKTNGVTVAVASEKELIIAPSFVHIPFVQMTFHNNQNISVAAQDVSLHDVGAHTGDVGNFQLKEFCSYCIVGHSERGESVEVVIAKATKCVAAGITPIICFTNAGDAKKYDEALLSKGNKVLLAWEDPSSISLNGVYRDKSPAEIEEAVRDILQGLPTGTELIYGGSVNRQNIQKLARINGLNGVLVGNASLDSQHFAELIQNS
jgi:triosephosphate isomerase